MDLSSMHTPPSIEDDEWDTDGFVIPSLGVEDSDETDSRKAEEYIPPTVENRKEENIYLGPHGTPPPLPPPRTKQPEQNSSGRKQRLKQKLKEADSRYIGTGRENKVDNLRELVGGNKIPVNVSKGDSPKEWLDPHCHESEFKRRLHR